MYSSQVLPEPKKNIQTCQQNMQGLNIPKFCQYIIVICVMIQNFTYQIISASLALTCENYDLVQ